MKNIKPDIDLQNSIERSRITESREYYKGKSFNFAKEWHPGINYFNDNYITDFVSYKGTLLVCRRTHLSSNSNRPELLFEDPKDSNQPTGVKSEYWDFILAGTPGPGGKVYIPNYNTSTGELSWVISDNIESIDPVNIKGEDGKDGRDGKDGKNGTNGKDGDTYVPQSELDNNYIVFKSLQGKETIKVDCSNLKGEPGERGEKGNDWVFSKVNTITLSPNDKGYADISADTPGSESTTYTLTLGIPQGKTGLKGNKGEKGEKGDQGEKGEAGPTPLFKLIRNESTRSIDLYWSIDEDSDWVNLGSVGGKSPKLLRVFDVAEHPNVQNSTRRDDRIVWGYDGISVSEWTTLCYLDELRGDENIWISTKEIKPGEGNPPVMEVRDPNNPEEIIQVEDKDKIWYDPFDISLDEFSSFKDVTLNENGNGIVITYTDLSTKNLDFVKASSLVDGLMSKEDKAKLDSLYPTASGSYESSLDPTVATVEKLGGIAAGTTVKQLTGKSYDEIFDTLIFPTVNPTFTAPSASISLKSYSNIQEIGADAPTAANFNVGFNPGAITLAGKKQNNRAGAQDVEASKILYGSTKVESLPSKVTAGAMDYYYRASYAEGPQPKDSKGNNYQTPAAAGNVDSGKVTVSGYRAAYSGLVSTNAITEDVIKGMTKTVSAKKAIKVSGPISEQYICFAAPKGWAVSNIKDSNNFDVTSTYTTSTVSVTGLDGQAVNYTVYLSGKMTQPGTYYVNFN